MQDKRKEIVDIVAEGIEKLRPKEGSGIDSVTLTVGGKSVTLKAKGDKSMIVDGKGIKVTNISKLKTTMEVKVDKEGNTSVAYSLGGLDIDLSSEEAKLIEKQANLQTRWTLELYPSSFNHPLPKTE
jgi:hypothetical protein